MRSICLLLTAAALALTPSCSLLKSVLKIPAGIIRMATRTVGLNGLMINEESQPAIDDADLGALRTPKNQVQAVGTDQ